MADYSEPAVSSTISPFTTVKSHWQTKIRMALEYKEKYFQKDANEARTFLKGGADLQKHLFGAEDKSGDIGFRGEGLPSPEFCLSLNRVAEMKDLFGPHLYHKNPHRQVNPRQQIEMPPELFMRQDPMMMQQMQMLPPEQQQEYMQFVQEQQQQQYQQYLQELSQSDGIDLARAKLLEGYLNWTPTPLGLRNHMRLCLDEAVVTGLGIMVTETYRVPGSNILQVGSFFDSNDNHAVDPDLETIEDALVWYRRRVRPVWQMEDAYGLPRGYLKGNASSYNQNSAGDYGGKLDAMKHAKGETNDLLVYWECWSKMGLGAKLSGIPSELRDQLDQFGDNVYLEICDTCPTPINFLKAKDGEDLQKRMRWPTPFWADDVWPFTHFQFHPQSRCAYPYSHVRPGLPELKFLSWCYSFLAGKIMNTCTDWIVTLKQAGAELKAAIRQGGGLRHIDLSASDGGLKISDVVQFLQYPEMNTDIFKVLERIELQFERRTGMTPLLYGDAPTQSRLAAAEEFKQSRSMVRVDDMADCVEEAATQMARKEGQCAAYHLIPERDIAPALGPQAAQFWGQLINFESMLHSMEFTIAAGSIRKPNRERDAANATTMAQTLLPILSEFAMAGQVEPMNEFLERWTKANDMKPLRIEPPPAQEGPSPEEQQAELEMAQLQAEMQADQQAAEMDAQGKQMDLQIEQVKAQQELQQDQMSHEQEMTQLRQKFELEMKMLQAKAAADKQIASQKVKTDAKMTQQKVTDAKKMGAVKVQTAKKQAAAKPKPAAKK